MENIEISQILSDAIKGKVDKSTISKNILKIFFNNSMSAITSITSIILIIIIHSISKNITEDLENTATSQCTYYVTYILIVTIVMKNFSDSITMIKDSIGNLVGFTNCLLPILISLVISTRKYNVSNNVRTNDIICYNFYK